MMGPGSPTTAMVAVGSSTVDLADPGLVTCIKPVVLIVIATT